MGIVFAVINAVLLGAANVLLKKSFKDFSPSISFFTFSIFALLLWLPLGIILGVQFDTWALGSIVGAVSALFGQAIYIYVLEKGEISITATILSTFSVYTVLFSILFNHEHTTVLTGIFVVLTILGTIIVSLPEKVKKDELKKVSFILWALFAAICVGASDTFSKYYINKTSVGSFLFFVSLAQVIVSYLYLKFDKQPLNQFKKIYNNIGDYSYALWGSLCIAVSTMFLFLAFNYTLASIASPIAASAPIVTVVLALVFLKEKISKKNWIGLLLVFFAIIALGITNP